MYLVMEKVNPGLDDGVREIFNLFETPRLLIAR